MPYLDLRNMQIANYNAKVAIFYLIIVNFAKKRL